MKKPSSVFMIRRDNVAMICPRCTNRKEGEEWAINHDREIILDFCPACQLVIEAKRDAGRKGGSISSEAKANAARMNGNKGGRPSK